MSEERRAAPGVAVPLVWLPAGRFRMGSAHGRPDERPVREVAVSAFALGRTAVTNAQYAPFLASGRASPSPWWNDAAFSAPEQPVVGVTWFDAVTYAEWLSEITGGRWRLPTEAEWEYAARGGLVDAATCWGDHVPPGAVPDGPLDGPWRVGTGAPNGFALCDMGTLVHEWCLDWYGADYSADAPARDPRGREAGARRASRGGSWRHHVRWTAPSARSSLPPEFRYSDYGFRVVREGMRPTSSKAVQRAASTPPEPLGSRSTSCTAMGSKTKSRRSRTVRPRQNSTRLPSW